MATSTDNSVKDQVGTVLRIKRKRNEDPLNTLIVHSTSSKKKKIESEETDQNDNAKCLFQFAGTICEDEIKTTHELVKSFRTKSLPHTPNIKNIKRKAKVETKDKHQALRYKIISKLREDETKDETTYNNNDDNDVAFSIYDVEQQATTDIIPTADELLCNSVKMIREKLTLYEKEEEKRLEDSEYVYDIYIAPDVVTVQNDEYLEIQEYYEELVNEYDSDVIRDDTDDENDADNWRNDYPDEDYYDSSDNDGEEGNSSDEEDFIYNGYRKGQGRVDFDPYAEYNVHDYFDTVANDDEDEDG